MNTDLDGQSGTPDNDKIKKLKTPFSEQELNKAILTIENVKKYLNLLIASGRELMYISDVVKLLDSIEKELKQ